MVKLHKRAEKKNRKEKAIVARVDFKLWREVMRHAIDNETTMTDIVEDCLMKYLDGKKKRLTNNDSKIK